MGCASSRQKYEAAVLSAAEKWPASHCMQPPTVAETVVTLSVKVFPPPPQATFMDANGTILARSATVSMFNKEAALVDPSGARIAITKARTFPSTEMRLFRYKPSYDGQNSEEYASDDKVPAWRKHARKHERARVPTPWPHKCYSPARSHFIRCSRVRVALCACFTDL